MRSKKQNIWAEVQRILDAGEMPIVTLPDAWIVNRKIKYSSPGRPKELLPEEKNFNYYAGYRDEKNCRPRCAKKGCNRYLRRNQLLVCSEYCYRQLLRETLYHLALLNRKRKVRFPRVFRG